MRKLLVAVYLIAVIALALASAHARTRLDTGAVCTTDTDCARWEARNGVPENERCYGAPCPK